MKPTEHSRPWWWAYATGGYGSDNRRNRRLERRKRKLETQTLIREETS